MICMCICPIEQEKAGNIHQTLQNAQQMNRDRNHADKGVISVNNYTHILLIFHSRIFLNSLHDLIIREMLRKIKTQGNTTQQKTEQTIQLA